MRQHLPCLSARYASKSPNERTAGVALLSESLAVVGASTFFRSQDCAPHEAKTVEPKKWAQLLGPNIASGFALAPPAPQLGV
jgi:hypothetical protein